MSEPPAAPSSAPTTGPSSAPTSALPDPRSDGRSADAPVQRGTGQDRTGQSGTGQRRTAGRRYARLWAGLPRDLMYLVVTAAAAWLLIGVFGSGRLPSLVAAAALVVLLTWVARPVGAFERRRLRWARTPPIAAPPRRAGERGPGLLAAVGDGMADGHSWLAALYLVLATLLAVVTLAIWAGWLVVTVALVGLPAWGLIVPTSVGGRPRVVTSLFGERLRMDGRPLPEVFSWLFLGRSTPLPSCRSSSDAQRSGYCSSRCCRL